MMQKETHRGIATNPNARNEMVPKTIINRLGQLSISLPRIDDEKRFAGWVGLAGTAAGIARLVPRSKLYVEPFAGSAKVFQELKNKQYGDVVLNDTSPFVRTWLQENMHAKVTGMDFKDCIKKYDSKDTFFLIDYPWVKSYYSQGFASFNRESVQAYEDEIIEICRKIRGKFMITSRKERTRLSKSGFRNRLLTSKYVLSGHYPQVLLTMNFKPKAAK